MPTVRVCVCVCICAFESVFFIRECEYVCSCIRAFECVSLPAYVIVYVFVFVRLCSACVYIRVCEGACFFSWVSVCTYELVCVSLYMCVCVRM